MSKFNMLNWMGDQSKLTLEHWLSDPFHTSLWVRLKNPVFGPNETFSTARQELNERGLDITLIPVVTDWCSHRAFILLMDKNDSSLNQPVMAISIYSAANLRTMFLNETVASFGDISKEVLNFLMAQEVEAEFACFLCQYIVELYIDARVMDVVYEPVQGTVKIFLVTPTCYVEITIDTAIINSIMGRENYFQASLTDRNIIYGRLRMDYLDSARENPTYFLAE